MSRGASINTFPPGRILYAHCQAGDFDIEGDWAVVEKHAEGHVRPGHPVSVASRRGAGVNAGTSPASH